MFSLVIRLKKLREQRQLTQIAFNIPLYPLLPG
jgi:hypothetical protein